MAPVMTLLALLTFVIVMALKTDCAELPKCSDPWELQQPDFDKAMKRRPGREVRVPRMGQSPRLVRGPLLITFEDTRKITEAGAEKVVVDEELSKIIQVIGLACCRQDRDKVRDPCQRGTYIFGPVKVSVQHYEGPSCTESFPDPVAAHKDMKELIENMKQMASNSKPRRLPPVGKESGLAKEGQVIQTVRSVELKIDGNIGQDVLDYMGVYDVGQDMQGFCCKDATSCSGATASLRDQGSKKPRALGRVTIGPNSAILGKRKRSP
ncbi:unnamed protein product [Calypogeia fissa]